MTSKAKHQRQHAIALQYEQGDRAPRVVASGAGELAKRILDLAREHKIPIQKNDSLAEILSKLNIGYEIPPETYTVVAQILAFLYRTDEIWRKEKSAISELISSAEKPEEPSD